MISSLELLPYRLLRRPKLRPDADPFSCLHQDWDAHLTFLRQYVTCNHSVFPQCITIILSVRCLLCDTPEYPYLASYSACNLPWPLARLVPFLGLLLGLEPYPTSYSASSCRTTAR